LNRGHSIRRRLCPAGASLLCPKHAREMVLPPITAETAADGTALMSKAKERVLTTGETEISFSTILRFGD
jgi:hypothetical protein